MINLSPRVLVPSPPSPTTLTLLASHRAGAPALDPPMVPKRATARQKREMPIHRYRFYITTDDCSWWVLR